MSLRKRLWPGFVIKAPASLRQSVGVAEYLLYRWKGQQDPLEVGRGLAVQQRTELKRLGKESHQENKELRMEKEVLKRPVPPLPKK